MWGVLHPHGTERLRGSLFPLRGAAGVGVWWGHLLTGARAAAGGQAEVSVGTVLMRSSPGCRSCAWMPLPRAVTEMASLVESPVCSQWLPPRLMVK